MRKRWWTRDYDVLNFPENGQKKGKMKNMTQVMAA
jgi:hypothetical protein